MSFWVKKFFTNNIIQLKILFNKSKYDSKIFFKEMVDFFFGFYTSFNKNSFSNKFKLYLLKFNDLRKYFLKKHIYTINHKRIALNYFYFSM